LSVPDAISRFLILLAWLLPDETHELSCTNSIRGKDDEVIEGV
jgi:hypothetical protein